MDDSEDLDGIAIGHFIDFLDDLKGLLHNLKDDRKREGGRERESWE